jgi:hypothetical protein
MSTREGDATFLPDSDKEQRVRRMDGLVPWGTKSRESEGSPAKAADVF